MLSGKIKKKKIVVSKLWKIVISASKRNVFFSVSDSNGKVRKLVTPGIFHKSGVTKEDYKRLHDRRSRRKKRSLRLYINNQKRSPIACGKAWAAVYTYLVQNKLLRKKFLLMLSGPSIKRGRFLLKVIIQRFTKIRIAQIIVKDFPPHNGCPQKIKKRKKNKGRNRWRKRLRVRPRPLKRARDKMRPAKKSDDFAPKTMVWKIKHRLAQMPSAFRRRVTKRRLLHSSLVAKLTSNNNSSSNLSAGKPRLNKVSWLKKIKKQKKREKFHFVQTNAN